MDVCCQTLLNYMVFYTVSCLFFLLRHCKCTFQHPLHLHLPKNKNLPSAQIQSILTFAATRLDLLDLLPLSPDVQLASAEEPIFMKKTLY